MAAHELAELIRICEQDDDYAHDEMGQEYYEAFGPPSWTPDEVAAYEQHLRDTGDPTARFLIECDVPF